MVEIELTKGYYALIDKEDYHLIVGSSWHYCNGYAVSTPRLNENKKFMHRVILGLEDKTLVVDHINGNKLDNRRSNLRICTQSQNRRNTKYHTDSAVQYKGVCISKSGKFKATIAVNYKQHHIGYFNTAMEAAKAYDYVAVKLHDEFANLNFPKARTTIQNILNNTLFQNATR